MSHDQNVSFMNFLPDLRSYGQLLPLLYNLFRYYFYRKTNTVDEYIIEPTKIVIIPLLILLLILYIS